MLRINHTVVPLADETDVSISCHESDSCRTAVEDRGKAKRNRISAAASAMNANPTARPKTKNVIQI